MENTPLKILAKTTQDLKVLSACLQDGLVPLKETEYDKNQKQFILLVNRYRWEEDATESKGTRIYAALSFELVTNVQIKGMDQNHFATATLSILSVSYQAPYVYITCSDNRYIRLEVDALKVKLRDASLAWPAKTPCHI